MPLPHPLLLYPCRLPGDSPALPSSLIMTCFYPEWFPTCKMIFPYLNQLHFSAPKLKISHSSPYHCHPFSLPLSKTFSPTEPFAIPGWTLVQEAYFVVAYLHILSHFPHWKVDPRFPFLTITNRMWLKWCYLTSVSTSESVLYLPPHSLGVHSQWETILLCRKFSYLRDTHNRQITWRLSVDSPSWAAGQQPA